jgi:glycosyltransferase involved in cell wall biosynthesis
MSARNEAESIADVISGFRLKAQEMGLVLQIHVVDDGSTDLTMARAISAGASMYRFQAPVGLAAAFNKELSLAVESGADYVIHIDADGQHSPYDLPKFIQKTLDGYDLILGNRLHIRPEFFADWQYHGNIFLSEVVSALIGKCITDSQTGYRVFSRALATAIRIKGTITYTQEQIVRAVHGSFSITEIPVLTYPRRYGTSRVVSDPLNYLACVFRDLQSLARELGLTLSRVPGATHAEDICGQV